MRGCLIVSVSWAECALRVQVHEVRQLRGEPVVTVLKGIAGLGKTLGKLPHPRCLLPAAPHQLVRLLQIRRFGQTPGFDSSDHLKCPPMV